MTRNSSTQYRFVLERLASRLEGALIRRSAVEETIAACEGDDALRREVERALGEASITVHEDVPVVRVAGPRAVAESAPVLPVDPLEIGRMRLEKDRGRPAARLAKIILTAQEEVGLTLLARPDARALEPGGFACLAGERKAAAEAMLLHNMGLIHSVAQRLGGQGLEYDDLVASGVPGLIRAIELFDPGRGLKFSTYAMNWVRQSIGRAIDDEGRIVRLPVHVCESIRALKAAQERLTVNGRLPSWAELARECRMPEVKVGQLLALAPAVVSLDSPVGNDGITLGDIVDRPPARNEPTEVRGLDAGDLEDLLGLLKDREADVLRRRHGLRPYQDKATLDEIGRAYGFTRERARQIESKAIASLRSCLGLEQPKTRSKPARRPNIEEVA